MPALQSVPEHLNFEENIGQPFSKAHAVELK